MKIEASTFFYFLSTKETLILPKLKPFYRFYLPVVRAVEILLCGPNMGVPHTAELRIVKVVSMACGNGCTRQFHSSGFPSVCANTRLMYWDSKGCFSAIAKTVRLLGVR